ncbi:MAG: hypothetical protein R3B54_10655 [Bdellovibrionota bacterium]
MIRNARQGQWEVASDSILIWGELAQLHEEVLPEVARRKCISVGVPKSYAVTRSSAHRSERTRIAILRTFTGRATIATTARLLGTIFCDASALRMWSLFLKGTASEWLSGFWEKISHVENVTWEGRDRGTESPGIAALIDGVDAVITTPSTVALDAALDRSVAVATYDLDLSFYEPLPLLRSQSEWFGFVESKPRPQGLWTASNSFAIRTRWISGASPPFRVLRLASSVFSQPTFEPQRRIEPVSAADASATCQPECPAKTHFSGGAA